MLRKCAFVLLGFAFVTSVSNAQDWASYLGDAHSSQYSTLDQIDRENVSTLELAWTYRTKDATDRSQIQCNPLIIDGVLYGTTPRLKAFALDAATGKELWRFNPFAEGGGAGGGVNRGVVFWRDGADRRILYTAGPNLIALRAGTGRLVKSFGTDGVVSLREGLGRDSRKMFVSSNTPGIVYQNLIIVGTRVSESLPAAPGYVRAYDIRTGEIAWTFRTIPAPGEFGYETWPADAHTYTGGANSWAGMSIDAKTGTVYVPTGSAAYDFYGGDRHGKNLFANSLLALDATTGKRRWHFQMVHHDVWDRDLPAPPNLVTLQHEGKAVEAVAQITKSAHVFLFDRHTGEPLFPIEERPYPPSDLRGEATWPTQPLPLKPPPFSRQRFTEDDVAEITPETHASILDRLRRAKSDGQFVPPSAEGSIVFPGFDGGGEWGGAAVDPTSGIMYVNASEMPWILQMVDVSTLASDRGTRKGKMIYARHCLYCHGVDRQGDPLEIYPPLIGLKDRLTKKDTKKLLRAGQGFMPSFEHLSSGDLDAVVDYLYDPKETTSSASQSANTDDPQYTHTGYIRFVDDKGYPAVKPPWGTLNAIDLNKGEILWKVVLGEVPELTERGLAPTGTENYGGPAVTAGGLIFIAATKDERFRAFDKDTGKLLWETQLPAGGYATPSVYSVNGKQYVVIACGGGKMGTKSGDSYRAYALPH